MAAAPPPHPVPSPDQQPVTVLDGGMGHLLKEWGLRLPGLPYEQQFCASVVANEADPAAVRRAHDAYAAAGARVLTTNSFAATRHALGKVGRAGDAAALAGAAARIAAEAARAASNGGAAGGGGEEQRVLVAGSLPPLCESYQTEGLPPPDEMRRQYAELAGALAPHADVFLAETLATAAEAEAAAGATAGLGRPLWVSFTLEDGPDARLRSGEPLEAAAAAALRHAHVDAVLVNCCAPAAVTAAMPRLSAAARAVAAPPRTVAVGAYANGFRTTTSEWLAGPGAAPRLDADEEDFDARGVVTPAAYARHARAWRAAGASIVGGCCGVGPEHIRAVVAELFTGETGKLRC